MVEHRLDVTRAGGSIPSARTMKYILVFCSAHDLEDKYVQPAREFAKLIAEHGYGLIWGGSDHGLMGTIAHTAKDAGGQIVGVSMELVKHAAMKDAHEMTIANDVSERKATMLSKADAVAVLVGGIGTFDEVTEVIELKREGMHSKPIVALNTDNFYEGFKVQLQKMKDDGFIKMPLDEIMHFADTPIDAIEFLDKSLL